MICAVLQNKSAEEILEVIEDVEMAEIRLDRCELSNEEIDEIFASDLPLIATCRIAGTSLNIAERRLSRAIVAGAKYIDLEMEAPKSMVLRLRGLARENGTLIIRSYHNFDGTPSTEELSEIVGKAFYHKADIVKIAAMTSSEADSERILGLYGDKDEYAGRLIAFGMGEAGRGSRVECLRLGAPFSYCAPDGEEPTAPGQLQYSEMHDAVYGDFRFLVDEEAEVPSSKSFAQRAIIAAALADGESHLSGYSPCGDSEAALALARALEAEVVTEGSNITIKGISATPGIDFPATISAGESGLLTRLMIPLSAALSKKDVLITGEKTLGERPMTGVVENMKAFGASVKSIYNDCRVPLKVRGPLSNGRIVISGKNGSQLVSGLLMALPLTEKNTTLVVTEPKSIPYMFITMDVLKKFGVRITNEMIGERDFLETNGDWNYCTEMDFKIKGAQTLKAADMDLEGDWSAAANYLVAGAVFGGVEVSGLDTRSLQADLSIMDILMDCGATLSQLDGDTGPIVARRAPLNAFSVDATHCPDLFPIVSILAAFCEGESRIGGMDRLAHKESNRGEAILDMLSKMGVEAFEAGGELIIKGMSLARRRLGGHMLKGGKYSSHHDHRMAMALKIASIGADSPIEIDDEECISKSFPDFDKKFTFFLQ